MSLYSERIEKIRTEGCDLDRGLALVGWWLILRPALLNHNRDFRKIQEHLGDELGEIGKELRNYGGKDWSPLNTHIEGGDAAWLPFSMALVGGVELDGYSIRSRVNGYGNKSNVLDLLMETAGNIETKTLKKDLEHYFAMWMSMLAGLPEYVQPDEILSIVYKKNSANYPREAFIGTNPFTQVTLNNDELKVLYAHARKCLRYIRDFQVGVLGRIDRQKGLKKSDYLPYMHVYIHAILQNSDLDVAQERADDYFAALKIQLYMDNNIPVPQNLTH